MFTSLLGRLATPRATALLLALALAGGWSGCSVYMAAKQPGRKDLSVLKAGTPRSLVVAELGAPVVSEKKDGRTVDVFAFQQGYSGGAKATRAVFHAAADVFTAGLWEVVGTPAEAIFSGTDVKLEITYDAEDEVERTRAFSGMTEVSAYDSVTTDHPAPSPAAATASPAVAAGVSDPAPPAVNASASVSPPAIGAPHGWVPSGSTTASASEALTFRQRLNQQN